MTGGQGGAKTQAQALSIAAQLLYSGSTTLFCATIVQGDDMRQRVEVILAPYGSKRWLKKRMLDFKVQVPGGEK